jgi:NADH-quinone oxidoreductase subunit M
VIAPLIILIVAIGVFPKPVLDRITPSVDRLIVHVDRATHTRLPADLSTGAPALGSQPSAAAAVPAVPDSPASPGGAP